MSKNYTTEERAKLAARVYFYNNIEAYKAKIQCIKDEKVRAVLIEQRTDMLLNRG